MAASSTQVGAHADLVSSTPAAGETVPSPPESVTMRFSESVSVADDGVRVFDPSGTRVPVSASVSGDTVSVPFPADAASGTWTISWALVSADGHPISGAWVFHIGAAQGGADIDGLISRPSPVLRWLRVASRALAVFALILLTAGVVWKPVSDQSAMVLSTSVWLGFVGAAAADLTSMAQSGSSTVSSVLGLWWSTNSGVYLAVAACTAVVAHVVTLGTECSRRMASGLWAIPLIALILSGHASVLPPWVASAVLTLVHVGAGCVWIGGVVGLERAMRPGVSPEHQVVDPVVGESDEQTPVNGPRPKIGDAARQLDLSAVDRVTMLATWSVAILGFSGVALVLLRVSLSDLWSGSYGRLSLVKLALFGVALMLAGISRYRLVPRMRNSDVSAERTFRRLVRAEVVTLSAAVVVGSVLGTTAPSAGLVSNSTVGSSIDQSPAGSNDAKGLKFHEKFGVYEVDVSVAPAKTGPNRFVVVVTDPTTGQAPRDLTELTMKASNTSLGIGPLEQSAPIPGSGAFEADMDLTARGTWTVIIDGRRGTFEFLRTTIELDL